MYSIVTVIDRTAEAVPDLVTVEIANAALDIEADTASDAQLADEITACSLTIATMCNRVFAKQDYRETFVFHSGEATAVLTLSRYPVDEIAEITLDGMAVNETEYEIEPSSGMVYRIGGKWSSRVVVTYTAGFDLPDDAPPQLARACLVMLCEQRNAIGRDDNVRSLTHGDEAITFFSTAETKPQSEAMESVAGLIAPFRRLAV
jgi:hypothetical protein